VYLDRPVVDFDAERDTDLSGTAFLDRFAGRPSDGLSSRAGARIRSERRLLGLRGHRPRPARERFFEASIRDGVSPSPRRPTSNTTIPPARRTRTIKSAFSIQGDSPPISRGPTSLSRCPGWRLPADPVRQSAVVAYADGAWDIRRRRTCSLRSQDNYGRGSSSWEPPHHGEFVPGRRRLPRFPASHASGSPPAFGRTEVPSFQGFFSYRLDCRGPLLRYPLPG
jgi:hypothetical protein